MVLKLHRYTGIYSTLSEFLFSGTYRIQDHEDGNEHLLPGAVQLRVIDPDRHDMLQKEYKGEGTFAFATSTYGIYEICFMKLPSTPHVKTVCVCA